MVSVNGLSSTSIQNPICIATSYTVYTVTITRSDSCHFKDFISVGVSSCHCEDSCNWSLTGNSLVKPWSYLGSRNDADIFFRRFNVPSGRLGVTNTAFGVGGVNPTSAGGFNSSYGASSMSLNSTGQYNVANGYEALHLNTSGENNTAIGFDALASNSTGSNNTAVGFRSLS